MDTLNRWRRRWRKRGTISLNPQAPDQTGDRITSWTLTANEEEDEEEEEEGEEEADDDDGEEDQ